MRWLKKRERETVSMGVTEGGREYSEASEGEAEGEEASERVRV